MSGRPDSRTPLRPLPEMNRPLVLVGHSAAMRRVAQEITAAAASNLTVLISGENGVGRRLIARMIHERSPRHSGPFLTVNCVCLPDARLESELFGRADAGMGGSESLGASGHLEAADGGTVVLHEVGFLSWGLQGRLHRFVDTHMIQRVGSSRPAHSDVRLVAITHRSLLHTIGYQPFRDDLFARINLISIEVPPLRDRSDDVPALFRYFTCVQAARSGRSVPELTPDALSCLSEYDWPGNVRELKDLAEQLTDDAPADRIGIEHLPPALVRRSMARTMARWGASATAPIHPLPALRHRH